MPCMDGGYSDKDLALMRRERLKLLKRLFEWAVGRAGPARDFNPEIREWLRVRRSCTRHQYARMLCWLLQTMDAATIAKNRDLKKWWDQHRRADDAAEDRETA
jgi:hypothetical protein